MPASGNIADRLSLQAAARPDQTALIAPRRAGWFTPAERQLTFREFDDLSTRIAAGLQQRGVNPGMRLALFVPFSIDFLLLTFGMFKAGATIVLIDPGMGRRHLLSCLDRSQPAGFVAIPLVHWVRALSGGRFAAAKFNVSTRSGPPGLCGTLADMLSAPVADWRPPEVNARDPAALIFTSGSTGPPKGVEYEHGMFAAQVDLIQQHYGIQPGEVDLPGFPLFGLFNAAMGVTTVIPDMDPTRPAQVRPQRILDAVERYGVTQAFGSPAFWNRIGRHCATHGVTLPSIKLALSAGGPVPIPVLERMQRALTRPGARFETPYGATESLPATSISANEILQETAAFSRQGRGTCVGRPFPGMRVKIIASSAGPLSEFSNARELPPGQIGEIVISGPSVTRRYFDSLEATQLSKIADGDTFWHRIGDVGYLDEFGRLWFCGRKAHVVQTATGPMYSVCCEAIFEQHPRVYRAALVGPGAPPRQRPVVIIEPEPGQFPRSATERKQFAEELLRLAAAAPLTQTIRDVLFHRSFPVDTRHNVKINREELERWARPRIADVVPPAGPAAAPATPASPDKSAADHSAGASA